MERKHNACKEAKNRERKGSVIYIKLAEGTEPHLLIERNITYAT